jgi:hypothetical protein
LPGAAITETESFQQQLHDWRKRCEGLENQLQSKSVKVIEEDLANPLEMTEAVLNSLANDGCYPESETDEDHSSGQTWWKRLDEIKTRQKGEI